MGMFDKLLSAVRLNDEFEDDFLDDDFLDDVDDDFLNDDAYSSKPGMFSRFGKKNSSYDDLDDLDDLDDFDEKPVKKPKKEKKAKEKPVREKVSYEKPVKEKPVKEEAPKERRSFGSAKPEKAAKSNASKVMPMRPSSRREAPITSMEVCVIQPKSMEDTHEIADTLQDNSTVILNLEGIDVELAQRISDFSFGACYALGGRLQKVSSYIFVLVPSNVDITGDLQNVLGASAPSLRAGY